MFFSRKKNIIQIIFVLLFFVLASKVDACSQLNSTKAIPAGFGASYDLILPGYTSLIKTDCSASSLSLEVGNNQTTQYIYKRGYFYRNGAWEPFTFSNATATSDWIIGTASGSIVLSETERLGTNYIVAYVCTWTGSEWKCGCRDKACANNFWQLQIFKFPGMSCFDTDGDKYDTCSVGDTGDDNKALDCNDTKSAVNPGALEVCDTFDNDCDGTVDEGCDDDKDLYCDSGMKLYGGNTMCTLTSFKGEGTSGSDCDDTNVSVNPGKAEVCDGVDNDCDKNTDEGCVCVDSDKDGYDTCGTGELGDDGKAEDCNDKAWERSPGAVEICDGVDNDCDEASDEGGVCCSDNDGDTYDACSVGAEGDDGKVLDCDDASWFMNPGAPETCDNYDNNCNGQKDEKCDEDGDGYCNSAIRFYNYPVSVCPKTNVANDSFGNDCSATDFNVNPGVTEKCNGIDDDCDTTVDENCSCTNGQTQACGIDTGACRVGSQTCSSGTWGTCAGEIVATTEVCGDSIDNDCDGQTDEGCSSCADNDKDGFDNCAIGTSGDDGKVIDCNDNEVWSNPGGVETCDSVDNNCSGVADEGCDDDRDRYCDSGMKLYGSNLMCPLTAFTINGMDGNDCDDTNLNVNPSKAEVCGNSLDDNCVSGVDEGCGDTNVSLTILFPRETTFVEASNIYFEYLAIGGELPITYKVESNIDRVIYSGTLTNFTKNNLSVGDHIITFTATDKNGNTASKTVNYKILSKTSISSPIQSPISGDKFPLGTSIYFSSYGGGAGGSLGVYTYKWTSNRDGIIGTAGSFSISTLSLGLHQITLEASDGKTGIYTETISVEIVNSLVVNVWPKVSVVEKGAQSEMSYNVIGGTEPTTLSITSDLDGDLGASLFFNTSRMTVGVHNITVKATDGNGKTGSTVIQVEIINATCIDSDGDGYGAAYSIVCPNQGVDCGDNDKLINPAATENCTNEIDDNCNGYIDECVAAPSILLPNENSSNELGSSMTFRVKAVGATYVALDIRDVNGTLKKTISLYDDGNHNDLLVKDGVYATEYVLSGLATGKYSIDVKLLATGIIGFQITSNARTFNIVESPKCISVVNNGSSADKLDIVFVPDQFTTAQMTTFSNSIQTINNYLLSITPYKENQGKINISRVDIVQNLGCSGTPNSGTCTSQNIFTAAASCPYDKVIVLANPSFRSWAYPGGYAMVSANYATYSHVVVHEFGHSFGVLADEYVYAGDDDRGASYVNASKNCDTSSICTKWAGTPGTGCFNGCAYRSGYYRSVNNGIMRDSNSTDYGVLNINHITGLLNNYK